MKELPIVTCQVPIGTTCRRLSINQVVREEGVSQTLRRRLRREGVCYVNGQPSTWDKPLQAGDRVAIYYRSDKELIPYEAMPPILYEDRYLLIVNKPRGLLMHQTASERVATLANAVMTYYKKSGQAVTGYHPVHRLDCWTSGAVIIAKNPRVQHAFKQKHIQIQKIYEAIVEGSWPGEKTRIQWPIGRKPGSIVERMCRLDGKSAVTDVEVLAKSQSYSHIRLWLHSGRTHQIRVHVSTMGYPLVGDDLYGGSTSKTNHQLLHARSLRFMHPVTEQLIMVKADLPRIFCQFIHDIQESSCYTITN